jgi:hypothetical protein
MKYLWKNFFSRLFDFIIWIYILSYLDLQSYIFKLFDSEINIVRIKNQHDDSEEDLSSFIVEEKNSIFKLICFELRTLFRFQNRKSLYLNEKQKIKSRMRDIITFMLEEIKFRMRDIVIFFKEIKFRNVKMLLYLLKNQLLTKVDFQMLAIELIIVRMMILRQSKKRRTLLRRRKFDVLIEST